MTLQIKDILTTLNHIAPFELAESWDNVGLLIGTPTSHVSSILVGLDPTLTLIEEAIQKGANTIITHHPIIFHPLTAIQTDTPSGKLLEKALCHKLNIIACHTNFDSAIDGVSDALGKSLGLTQLKPLCPCPDSKLPGTGLGRVGYFSHNLSIDTFLKTLFSVLDLPSLQIVGTLPRTVTTVALCGGGGSDFAEAAMAAGADLYLSAEIKHSTARWAEESGFCIIDGTHYATEKPMVKHIADHLKIIAKEEKWLLDILQTETEHPPFSTLTPNTI